MSNTVYSYNFLKKETLIQQLDLLSILIHNYYLLHSNIIVQ